MLETIAASARAVAVIGTVRWFLLPLRNKADRKRMAVTSDHGLVIRTYPNSDAMSGLSQKDLLGAEPGWLADTDFYFRHGSQRRNRRPASPSGPLGRATTVASQ